MCKQCACSTQAQAQAHTSGQGGGGGREALIASVKNLHAGHLCESLLVEMKGAGASKPCVLSVP